MLTEYLFGLMCGLVGILGYLLYRKVCRDNGSKWTKGSRVAIITCGILVSPLLLLMSIHFFLEDGKWANEEANW